MEKSVQITLIIVGAILLITAAAGFGLWALVNPSNDISVNGVATLKAVPDVITVYFNVETIGSTAQIAKDDNAAIVDEVTTRLVKLGLERKDITTENFNIGEKLKM